MGEIIHVLAADHDLIDEAVRLSEHRAQDYLSPARKEAITKQMGYIFFELQQRNEVVLLEVPSKAAV